jgi:hypothetical protein
MEKIPVGNNVLHAAARTPDDLLIFDTCPSEEAYRAFFDSDPVRRRFAECGLRLEEAVEDFPVTRAYARRVALTDASWDVV